MNLNEVFEFDYGAENRAGLLAKAQYEVKLSSELGIRGGKDPAKELLDQLNRSVAEFGAFPEVVQLKAQQFTQVGLAVPKLLKELSKKYNFYWMRIPFTLYAVENMPFTQLKCGIELGPDVTAANLKPVAQMILPDKKFKQLLEFQDSLELGVGENLEFEAAASLPKLEAGKFKGKADLGVDIKAAGKMGLVVGPFKYTWKKATLDHTPPGTEKVIWRLESAEYFQENDGPTFLVVMKVPKTVQKFQVAAAMETRQKFDWGGANPPEAFKHLSAQIKNFFKQGAPIQNTRIWDISEN